MALWGKTDTLASTPKFVARKAFFDSTAIDATAETINLASANTGFSTGDAVYYSINGGTVIGGLTDATTYYVRVVGAALIELYDTYANATASSGTTGRLNITGAGVGTHTLQRTGAANPFGDHNYNGSAIVFIDAAEAVQAENIARGLTGAGWWLYKQYTDVNSVLRRKAECLIPFNVEADVSQPGTTGDGNDDTIAVDRSITISAQPQDDESASGSEVTFSVTAAASPTTTLTYLWQVSTDSGDNWASASGTNNAASYVIADNTGLDGNQYRVVISAAGATSATSTAATLTEAA
jgi:hypothetical protein